MLRMEDSDGMLRTPWTPNSGLKLFGAHTENVHLDQLLDHTASPMLSFGTQLDDFRSPSRPSKRLKAPPSPATAMLLHAARHIEGDVHSGTENVTSPDAIYDVGVGVGVEHSPSYQSITNDMSPVSPVRTPSRLLFSPRSETRETTSDRGIIGSSPSKCMITSYDGMLNSQSNPNQDLIGSIWKQSASVQRKNAKSAARRPLLQQTPGGKKDKSNIKNEDPVPLPVRTPTLKSKVAKRATEPRKDRKTYSTAGRPRVRGEYKCGKCGFYPKKARHDCDAEKIRQTNRALIPGDDSENSDRLIAFSPSSQTSNAIHDTSPLLAHSKSPITPITPQDVALNRVPIGNARKSSCISNQRDTIPTVSTPTYMKSKVSKKLTPHDEKLEVSQSAVNVKVPMHQPGTKDSVSSQGVALGTSTDKIHGFINPLSMPKLV